MGYFLPLNTFIYDRILTFNKIRNNKMNIINLTKHVVSIVTNNNNVIDFQPSGIEARCVENTIHVGDIDGIPVFETGYGDVIDLPEQKEDTIYIVSTLVRLASPDRHDLYSPAKPVRNEAGQIVGCMGLNK